MLSPKLPFTARVNLCRNAAAKRLCQQVARKNSNLVLAADVTQSNTLLQLADQLGPMICLLKTHIDILTDFTPQTITQLQALATKHGFLLCEDRKFADIGHTVQQQYYGGLYRIASWADFVTVHTVAGPGTLAGLQHKLDIHQHQPTRGFFLIAEMSSAGQLAQGNYTTASLAIAHEYPGLVAGFIGQKSLSHNPGHLQLTPGIQLQAHVGGDGLGQCYRDPIQAIQSNGSDLIIVGRGILNAEDPCAVTEQYRQIAWKTYVAHCA